MSCSPEHEISNCIALRYKHLVVSRNSNSKCISYTKWEGFLWANHFWSSPKVFISSTRRYAVLAVWSYYLLCEVITAKTCWDYTWGIKSDEQPVPRHCRTGDRKPSKRQRGLVPFRNRWTSDFSIRNDIERTGLAGISLTLSQWKEWLHTLGEGVSFMTGLVRPN